MGKSAEVKIFANPEKVVIAFIHELLSITQTTNQPTFNVALSGGKTPVLLFETLAEKYHSRIPWEKVHFWWGDERCVSPDSKESNYRNAYKKLLSKCNIPKQNIHRIKGEDNPESEAARYSKEINSQLNTRGEWPVFDLIILGMGKDGHTASIFPGELEELMSHKNNYAVATHPLTGQKRITITGKVLNNSNRVFFLVTGKNKALRVSEIMNNDEAAKLLPAFYIQPENGELIWYIDQDAASLIT